MGNSLARPAWLAALLLAAWIVARPGLAEARHRLVVLELEGDRAEDFQDELEKFLKKTQSVVPLKKWTEAAEDLSATKVNDKNVKKVAKKLSIDGVISGSVEKRGSRYYITLDLRDGTTGKKVNTTELVERAPKLSADGKQTLTDELLAAVDELESAGDDGGDDDADGGDDDTHKPHAKHHDDDDGGDAADSDDAGDDDRMTAKERKAKAAREKAEREKAARDKKHHHDDDQDDIEIEHGGDDDGGGDRVADRDDDGGGSSSSDDDDDVELGHHHGHGHADADADADADVSAVVDPRTRPFDLSAGLSFTARRLSFSTDLTMNQPLGYKSNPVAGVMIAGDLYPLAFNRKNHAITRDLGLTFVLDRVIKIDSQIEQSGMVYKLGTTEQHLGIGVVYRHLIGKKLTLTGSIRYNKRKFVIDHANAAMPDAVDIPNVSYSYVDPGLGIRDVLGPKMAIGADARFLFVTDTGAMQLPNEYGGAKVTGFDLGGRFDYQLGPKLLVRAAVGLTRISFSFKGNGMLSNNRDGDSSTIDVSGATDLYFGGAVTGVYLF
ncbi:MAG TPA: hypothetical protein VHE35_23770 [Kofleriaceae bacterium]|nr:hypothetical protein [Kofleriaceae bacterium]